MSSLIIHQLLAPYSSLPIPRPRDFAYCRATPNSLRLVTRRTARAPALPLSRHKRLGRIRHSLTQLTPTYLAKPSAVVPEVQSAATWTKTRESECSDHLVSMRLHSEREGADRVVGQQRERGSAGTLQRVRKHGRHILIVPRL